MKGQTTFEQPASVQLELACLRLFGCTSLFSELKLPPQSAVETTDVRMATELNPVLKLGGIEPTGRCVPPHISTLASPEPRVHNPTLLQVNIEPTGRCVPHISTLASPEPRVHNPTLLQVYSRSALT